MADAFQSDAFQLSPLAFQIESLFGPVFPDPDDVRLGVQYGPTGTEYTGTLVVGSSGGGNLIMARRR